MTSGSARALVSESGGNSNQDVRDQDQTGARTLSQNGRQDNQIPAEEAATETAAQSQQAEPPPDLTPEEAEQIVRMARSRSQAERTQRQAQRRNRMVDDDSEKYW